VELDMVARHGDAIVFIEVKTRSTDEFGTPDQAVDREKRSHILRAAAAYMHAAQLPWDKARFDIVSVTLEAKPRIVHQRDAFARPPI
jgi:putative endonuclease